MLKLNIKSILQTILGRSTIQSFDASNNETTLVTDSLATTAKGLQAQLNNWSKIASFKYNNTKNSEGHYLLVFDNNEALVQDSTLVSLFIKTDTIKKEILCGIQVVGKGGNSDSNIEHNFKLVCNQWNTVVDLWIQTKATDSQFTIHLVSDSVKELISTWYKDSPWVNMVPTGALVDISSMGLTYNGFPILHAGIQSIINQNTEFALSTINGIGLNINTEASAVNYLEVKGVALTHPLSITALGSDSNININVVPKGTGVVNILSNLISSSDITASHFIGDGSQLTNLSLNQVISGIIPTNKLGLGTPTSTTFLRGDGIWAEVPNTGTGTGTGGGTGTAGGGDVYLANNNNFTGINTFINAVNLNSTLSIDGVATFNSDIKASSFKTTDGSQLTFSNIAGAVNYFTLEHSITTNNPRLLVSGTDTNIGIDIKPKGLGNINLGEWCRINQINNAVNGLWLENAITANKPTLKAYGLDTNIGLNFKAKGNGSILFSSDTNVLELISVTNAINYLSLTNTVSNSPVLLTAIGSDSNIDIAINPKGAGKVSINSDINCTGTTTSLFFYGNGSNLTNLNANNIASGTINSARLGSGTASTSTFLRGDGTWATPPAPTVTGGDVYLTNNNSFSGNNTFINSLTVPSFSTAAGIQLAFDNITSAVNYIKIAHSTSSNSPTLSVAGTATNIGLTLLTKGTGSILLKSNNANALSISNPSTAVNSFLLSGSITNDSPAISVTGSDASINLKLNAKASGLVQLGSENGIALEVSSIASSSEYIRITNALTGNGPSIGISSVNTNVNLTIVSKGTGVVNINNDTTTIAKFNPITLAVNYLNVSNAVTASNPIIESTGTDTNVGLTFKAKGTGQFKFLSNAGSTTGLIINGTALTVNYLTVSGSLTTQSPSIAATGTDTNIGISLLPKGTGVVSVTGNLSVSSGLTASTFTGNGSALTNLNASNLATGTVPTARLGSGTPNAVTYLRGDGTWSTPAGSDVFLTVSQTFTGINTFSNKTNLTTISSNGLEQLTFVGITSAVNYLTITQAITNNKPQISTNGLDTDISLRLNAKGVGLFSLTNASNDYLDIQPSTGSITFNANGSSTNVDINITPKGTGKILSASNIETTADIHCANIYGNGSNLTGVISLTANNTFSGNNSFNNAIQITALKSTDGNQLSVTNVASAVNYINLSHSITGNGPIISAVGTDTNIDLVLAAKGTGKITSTFDISTTGDLWCNNIHSNGGSFASLTGNNTFSGNNSFSNNVTIPTIQTASGIQVTFADLGSVANNYIIIGHNNGGTGPSITSAGPLLDVDLNIVAKGNGKLYVTAFDAVFSGYMECGARFTTNYLTANFDAVFNASIYGGYVNISSMDCSGAIATQSLTTSTTITATGLITGNGGFTTTGSVHSGSIVNTGTLSSGATTITGTCSATTFSGSGASLTSLNATNLASGTVPTARLGTGTANSTTYLRGDGTWAAATSDVSSAANNTFSGTNIFNNTVTVNSTLNATNFSGGGSAITALNASNLGSGTVPTARLGSGAANATTYLRGDGTWASVSGGSGGGSGGLVVSAAFGLSAAGTNFATATTIGSTYNEISTVAVGTGVSLPAVAVSSLVSVINNGVNNLNVYPFTGDAIGSLAVNAPYVLLPGQTLELTYKTTGIWGIASIVMSSQLITQFAKSLGGKYYPATQDGSGAIIVPQPHIGRVSTLWWQPLGGTTTVPLTTGIVAAVAQGTATARTMTVTNKSTRTRRLGYVSAATAGSLSGIYWSGYNALTLGDGSGNGGFTAIFKFSVKDAAAVAGARQFIGVSTSVAAATNVEPSTIINCIGLAQLSTDNTQWYLCYGGSAAQTPIALGTALGAPTDTTKLFELVIFAFNNTLGKVGYLVTNIDTGVQVSGIITGTDGTTVPASTTFLSPRFWRCNNATALAVGLDICSLYIEVDN